MTSRRDQTCFQSNGYSYPSRWVAKKGRAAFGDTIVNRSCSGATVTAVRTRQLGDLDKNTGWVTVTVGGNDIGFTSTLTTCVLGSDASCATAVQAGLGKATTTLPGALDSLFTAIRSKAPNAKVYVVGLHRLAVDQPAGCRNAERVVPPPPAPGTSSTRTG